MPEVGDVISSMFQYAALPIGTAIVDTDDATNLAVKTRRGWLGYDKPSDSAAFVGSGYFDGLTSRIVYVPPPEGERETAVADSREGSAAA